MNASTQQVTLIGFGAIGRSIFERMLGHPTVQITHVVVSPASVSGAQAFVASRAIVCTQVPVNAKLVLECAGHFAFAQHVLPALRAGAEVAVLSIGALSEPGLVEEIAQAAEQGKTQLHLLAGAVGGIDAIAAARLAGLDSVTYTGRKPPLGWKGTPAEQAFDLERLVKATIILQASAREAARLYPKNANVAATVSLAGLGLDATQVCLIADPTVTENIHEIEARGAFGQINITMRGKPLADNPKTSALTVLSALRFLNNRTSFTTL